MAEITLTLLTPGDREQFIRDNRRAFQYGATEEFGCRDDPFEEEGEIISRTSIFISTNASTNAASTPWNSSTRSTPTRMIPRRARRTITAKKAISAACSALKSGCRGRPKRKKMSKTTECSCFSEYFKLGLLSFHRTGKTNSSIMFQSSADTIY